MTALPAVLALLIWWQHTRHDPLARDAKGTLVDPGDAVAYVVTPLLFVALALQVPPAALAQWRGVVPLALGLLYLGAGWRGAEQDTHPVRGMRWSR